MTMLTTITNLIPLIFIVGALALVIFTIMNYFPSDDPMEHVYYLEEVKRS